MTEEVITREKHPGRVAQGHSLAALMKTRKEEILRNKEQSTEQSTVQCTVQSTVQTTVQSNDIYTYDGSILAVLDIGVCIFFDWKKNIKDSIKDEIIITATTTGIFFALKAANIKPPKASMDAMDIMKLVGGICGGVLVKYCEVYKKWINK